MGSCGKILLLSDTDALGLVIFDPKTGKVKIKSKKAGLPYGPSTDSPVSAYEDKDNVLWVLHNNGKVDKHDPRMFRFDLFKNIPTDPNSLAYDAAMPIYQDRHDNIWIGTFGKRLDLYDPDTQTFSHFIPDESDATSIPQGYPCGFFEDRQGNLYVSTFGALVLFDPITRKVRKRLTDNTSFYTLYRIKRTMISSGPWVGT